MLEMLYLPRSRHAMYLLIGSRKHVRRYGWLTPGNPNNASTNAALAKDTLRAV